MLARGMHWAVLVAAPLALVACVDEEEEFARAPGPQQRARVECVELPRATADDSFWLAQAASQATEPPRERARSVSLGYAGDGVLAGGVTRDTPMTYVPGEGVVEYAPEPPPFSPHMDPEAWRRYRAGMGPYAGTTQPAPGQWVAGR